MDPAEEEVPQVVRPKKKPHVDGEAPLYSPTQPFAVTKVLDDDNLVREIIARVGFPTTLVRAALVCTRWLGHASDPMFLNRFRKLHPPRLLGYYITKGRVPRFVPMLPQPPELSAVIRRLERYRFGAHEIMHCQNDRIFTKREEFARWTHGVHRPLCAEKGMQIFPPLPRARHHNYEKFSAIVSKEEGSVLSYLYVLGESTEEAGNSMACVYKLQDGVWRMHTSATCLYGLDIFPRALLVGNKIYMPAASGDGIIVFDLSASSFSKIQLPRRVRYRYYKSILSRADDASSLYLIHVKKFRLRIWLHKGDNWLLVDTICLHEMFAILRMSDHTIEDENIAHVQICQVGDNGRVVLLRMGHRIFYLEIKRRTMCKVNEDRVNARSVGSIHPLMMIWPPTFPAIKDDPARKLSDGQ